MNNKILLVDDDVDILSVTKDILLSICPHLVITTCTEARDAIHHIENVSYDLVLTDMGVGKIVGGDEVVKAAKEKGIFVAMVSGGCIPPEFKKMCDYTLKKPWSAADISRLLRAANIPISFTASVKARYVLASLLLPKIKWSYPTDKEILNEIKSEHDIEKLLNPFISSYPKEDDYALFVATLKEVSNQEVLNPKAVKGNHHWENYDDLVKTVKNFGLPKDPDKMLNAIKEGKPLPMPIALRSDTGEMVILGGATRAGIASLAGQKITALVLDEKAAKKKLAEKIEQHADALAKEDKRKNAFQKMRDYYLNQKEKPEFVTKEERFHALLAEHLYKKVAELRGLPTREWVTKKN